MSSTHPTYERQTMTTPRPHPRAVCSHCKAFVKVYRSAGHCLAWCYSFHGPDSAPMCPASGNPVDLRTYSIVKES